MSQMAFNGPQGWVPNQGQVPQQPPQQGQAPGVFTPPAGGGGYSTRPQQPTRLFSNLQTSNPSQNNNFDHGGGRYWQVIRKVRAGVNNSNQGYTAVDKEVIRVIDLKPAMYGIHPMGFGEVTTHMFSEKHLPSAGNWLAFLVCVTGQTIEWCRDIQNTFNIINGDKLNNMVVEVDTIVDLTRTRRQPITKPNYVRVVPPDEVKATLDDATIARFFPHGQLDQLVQSYCTAMGRAPMAPLPQRIGQAQMVSTAPAGMVAPAPVAPPQQWAPPAAPQPQNWAPVAQPPAAPQQWAPPPQAPAQQWAPQQAPAPAGPAFQGYFPPQSLAQASWQQPPVQAPAPSQWQTQGGASAPAY